MEREFTFSNEDHAMQFCWEVLKLGTDTVKIDRVVQDEDFEYTWVSMRFWKKETEVRLENLYDDTSRYTKATDNVFKMSTQEANSRNAVILAALSKGLVLKSKLVDDADAADAINDLVYAVVEATTLTAPGPSSKVYNFAMDQLDREERIGSYV